MSGTQVLTLQVSDIVNWFRNQELIINETFQRRAVWSPAAKTYLIDTILEGLPIPKVYIRTKIDPTTQKSIREVVDGQQRIRALVEFANGDLRLTKRSTEYKGLKYTDLGDTLQEQFLGYVVTVEQLLNADDDKVLEVFARLNTYTVKLNDAEKRHAEFQTDFKVAVRNAAQRWGGFLEQKNILSLKQRFRMMDDELLAEMYRILIEGVCDGGAPKLKALYTKQTDEEFTAELAGALNKKIDECLKFLSDSIADAIVDELATPYQLLMMFAAVAHCKFGIPKGDLAKPYLRKPLAAPTVIMVRLGELLNALQTDDPPTEYRDFVIQARKTSPQRIAARRIRFKEMLRVFWR